MTTAGPLVDLDDARVLGTVAPSPSGNVDVFRGIRYAAPPVGDLRWRRARPLERSQAGPDGIIDATAFGPVAPQGPNPMMDLGAGVRQSEDCLFLNIWAPAGARYRSTPLAVMVWIHGGAYVIGASTQPIYDAADLARSGNVIVVTLNYRLGALGFADLGFLNDRFGTERLGADEHGSPRFESNTALSDVLAALRWVREHIASFGGDPGNVTVFGESAGGGMVTTLLTMPSAEGLFHKAIAQSSPVTSMYDHQRAWRVGQMLVDDLDLADDPAGLTTVEADTLVAAAERLFESVPAEFPGTIAWAPVVDGDLVLEHPIDAYRGGRSLPVPLLIGTNKDEARLFRWMSSPLMPITPADIERMFAGMVDEYPDVVIPDRAQIVSAYAGMRPKVAGMGVARDVAFRMPTLWLADGHTQRAPVYVYRFDWSTLMLRALRLGAAHATELPYLFGNLVNGSRDITFKLGGRATGEGISARMQERWTSFARHGDPAITDPDLPWPAYDTATREVLLIDREDRVVADPDAELRAAWGDEVLTFR